MAGLLPGRLVGLQGRLARPLWGLLGLWAVLCGALASNRLRWNAEELLALALALFLAELAWGSLWDLVTGTEWFHPLAESWPPAHPVPVAALPYTRPDSPGGRLARGLGRWRAWWRESFWPVAGGALLALLASIALATILSLLLPARVRLLNAGLVALVGLGLAQRRRGRDPLAGEALVQVGLGWLLGHAVLTEISAPSLGLALAFSLSIWGGLRLGRGLPCGLWLLNGGQVIAAALLAVLQQPLAAAVVGLLLLGQVALQPSLHQGGDPARIWRRSWPWIMAALLVAALAVP
jgi:hypothetical protein